MVRLAICECFLMLTSFNRKRRPYGGGSQAEDTMIRNSLRVAHVWMDKYIEFYYQVSQVTSGQENIWGLYYKTLQIMEEEKMYG